MKRAVIVHCWDGTPNYCWYPWTKDELEKIGFSVQVPAMPETEAPKLSLWLPALQKVIGKPDEDLYLIGHSIGCATIMRYLETLKDGEKVGGIILVAGFTDNLKFDELINFFTTPLDFAKIKSSVVQGTYLIHSSDDPYVPVRYGEELRDKLSGKLIVLKNMGHFSGPVDNEKSCKQLPKVIKAVQDLSSFNI